MLNIYYFSYDRTIILFLIIPSECSFPTNMLTNIDIKSPIYSKYSFIKLYKLVPYPELAILNNASSSMPIVAIKESQNLIPYLIV